MAGYRSSDRSRYLSAWSRVQVAGNIQEGSEFVKIPFGKPFIAGRELEYIARAVMNGSIAGDGAYTKLCQAWLQSRLGTPCALLTHSCTAALEMAAILLDVKPGDEIIMPS